MASMRPYQISETACYLHCNEFQDQLLLAPLRGDIFGTKPVHQKDTFNVVSSQAWIVCDSHGQLLQTLLCEAREG